MRRRLLLLLALFAVSASTAIAQGAPLERAKRILRDAPLIDGHNDVVWEIRTSKTAPFDVDAYDLRTRVPGHTDFDRLAAGGVGAQFWSIYVPGDIEGGRYARTQLEEFDIARRMVAKYPDRLLLAGSSADIERALKERKVASLLGMEGGHAIENSLGALRAYYDLGARYMTLAHTSNNDICDSSTDPAGPQWKESDDEESSRGRNRRRTQYRGSRQAGHRLAS